MTKPDIRYKTRPAKSTYISLRALVFKAESVTHPFNTNHKGNVSPIDESLAETNSNLCFECKGESYPFVQDCKECRHDITTFCISHALSATKTCNMSDHYETIFRRIEQSHFSSLLKLLKGIFNFKTESLEKRKLQRTTSQNK